MSLSRAWLSARRHRSLLSCCRLRGGDGGGGDGLLRRVRRRGGVFRVRRAARHPRGHACAANARACVERAARGRARAPSLVRRALGYGSLERARDGDDGGGGGGYVRRVRRRGGVFRVRRAARHPRGHACAANARACLERAARGRARAPSLGRRALGFGCQTTSARARRRRRRRRCAVVVFTRTGVAGPYTHESRHLLISNASHMYNERNRLTRQVSRAPLAPRAPRHRRVLSRPHKRVVLVERAPVRLGTLHEFSHRVVPLEPVRFRGPEQHV